MNILEAMKAMDEGHVVTHPEFPTRKAKKGHDIYVWDRPYDLHIALSPCLQEGWELYREYFDFQEALHRMKAGKRVRRAAWNSDAVLVERCDLFCFNSPHYWLYPEDTRATDWEEV